MKVATSRQLFKELICLKTRAFRTSFTKMAKLSNNFEGPESQTRVIKFDSGRWQVLYCIDCFGNSPQS